MPFIVIELAPDVSSREVKRVMRDVLAGPGSDAVERLWRTRRELVPLDIEGVYTDEGDLDGD